MTSSPTDDLLLEAARGLTRHHSLHCPAYARILHALGNPPIRTLEDVPALPVALFKHLDLRSIPTTSITHTMLSSGTSGAMPSKVFVDRETSLRQARALSQLVRRRLGVNHAPILVLDAKPDASRREFSARGAAVRGFANALGSEPVYALSGDYGLDIEKIQEFASQHGSSPAVIFGFTFLVWQTMQQVDQSPLVHLPASTLVHGGGWKKMSDAAVTRDHFRSRALEVLGVGAVVDYYGLVEQTGSIFFECEEGFFHDSEFSTILIRSEVDLSPVKDGTIGLIQLISSLPTSYPGHSILTEDRGVLHGRNACECGRMGKFFSVVGRVPTAEARGCSDATNFAGQS